MKQIKRAIGESMRISDEVMTHAGRFHADDVFSAALLKIVKPEVKVKRVMHVPEDFDGIAFDIGGGRYDHHQKGAEVRESGYAYAAFGLLWRDLGPKLVGREMAEKFDKRFVEPLDINDTTGAYHPLARVIGNMNPIWDEEADIDVCFERAVALAKVILEDEFRVIAGIQRANHIVEEALEKNSNHGVLILDRGLPWKEPVVAHKDIDYVVYPSERGGYNGQVVERREADGEEATGLYFPEQWAGESAENLRKMTGVEDFNFCHAGRFLISASTLESALKLCEMSKKIAKEEENASDTEIETKR